MRKGASRPLSPLKTGSARGTVHPLVPDAVGGRVPGELGLLPPVRPAGRQHHSVPLPDPRRAVGAAGLLTGGGKDTDEIFSRKKRVSW